MEDTNNNLNNWVNEEYKKLQGEFTISAAIEATAAELEEVNDTLRNWVIDSHDPNDAEHYKIFEKRAVLIDHVLRWLVELRDIKNGNDGAKFEEAYTKGYADGRKATPPVKHKYKYIVVRSYTDNCAANKTDVENAFKNGFEFVHASEVVQNGGSRCNYIEYILRKEVNTEDEKNG